MTEDAPKSDSEKLRLMEKACLSYRESVRLYKNVGLMLLVAFLAITSGTLVNIFYPYEGVLLYVPAGILLIVALFAYSSGGNAQKIAVDHWAKSNR